MENRLYIMNTDALSEDALLLAASGRLSETRRAKAERLVFRRDRNLSIGAGLLLDHALRRFGLREKDMQYGVRENGKPYFPDHPELCFNLSHSGSMALCAVSGQEVGCDIEAIAAPRLGVARRSYTEREYNDVLSRTSESEQAELFFRYWSLKESYMKFTGLGLALRTSVFEIRMADGGISVRQNGYAEPVCFTEYRSVPGYACAVCARADFRDVPLTWVTAAKAL